MSKFEIDSKFDEIVAFSEIEKFIDTPVKRYSSGMYVRLAFAVAAHLEPEILIVDEVLAVGDAAFQKKCIGKMQDVSDSGRTILFVSHQMDSVQKLCNKGILLQKGELISSGDIGDVIQQYLRNNKSANASFDLEIPDDFRDLNGYAKLLTIEAIDGKPISEISMGKPWRIRIQFVINKKTPHFIIACGTSSMLGLPMQTSWSLPQDLDPGEYEVLFTNNDVLYTEGQYKLVVGLSSEQRVIQYIDNAGLINISDVSDVNYDKRIVNTKSALILNQMDSEIKKIA